MTLKRLTIWRNRFHFTRLGAKFCYWLDVAAQDGEAEFQRPAADMRHAPIILQLKAPKNL